MRYNEKRNRSFTMVKLIQMNNERIVAISQADLHFNMFRLIHSHDRRAGSASSSLHSNMVRLIRRRLCTVQGSAIINIPICFTVFYTPLQYIHTTMHPSFLHTNRNARSRVLYLDSKSDIQYRILPDPIPDISKHFHN